MFREYQTLSIRMIV